MKVALLLALLLAACGPPADPVNAVIGDASWTLDRAPASEVERVQTHLVYVADLLARRVPSEHAGERARLIEMLRGYAARGEFPHLDGPTEHRTPRFIDREGRWCAVGYLIARTVGNDVAQDIAAKYEYARIAQIDDPRLDAWADAHGFTRTELATIQPEYGFEPSCDHWGNHVSGGDQCPSESLRERRLLWGFGLGGGVSRADGRDLSYFLWGGDVRLALTSWLALGIGDLGVRLGHGDAGNHLALTATPLVEIARWFGTGYAHRGNALHLDLGITAEHVIADAGPKHPYAAEAAVGFRWFAQDVAEPDVIVGLAVSLADGFVVDDRVSVGSVMPFVRLALGWRP